MNDLKNPGVVRCLASMLYDALLLLALLFVATLPYLLVFGQATEGWSRHLFQAYLWAVSACYFLWFWLHGGQTLAMQTWRIRVTNRLGQPISWQQAVIRYLCATMFFGVGLLWAIFDREGLFLHDRFSGCRLVLTDKRKQKE